MPLLSVEFALFWLLFFPLYWCFAHRPQVQNHLLLAAGLGWLYRVDWAFVLALVLFSLGVLIIASGLVQTQQAAQRRRWLAVGCILAVANLAFFKYVDFFRPAVQAALGTTVADILMPLGLSYYTFQAVAYLVSLYRHEDVRLRWRELLLHFGFLPTLTAGPIARAGSFDSIDGMQPGMAAQIRQREPRRIIRPALAVALIVLGIAKKWAFAGTLAEHWVDPVFANPMQYDGLTVLTALYGYTVQLFLDFSGYTDMVIGMAMLLGFTLPANFRMPLRAFNIRDFWNRWHISLSTWIRDHIYIPLGGSRRGFVRTQINLLAAMVLSGIWHGYGWNFFLWGLLHGLALVALNCGDKLAGKREWLSSSSGIGHALAVLATVNFVCMAFVVFRTATLDEASLMFRALFNGGTADNAVWWVLAAMAAALAAYGLLTRLFDAAVARLEKMPLWLWPLPLTAAMMLVILIAPSGIPGFIYANF
ncbi:D-alanyl-lipoteichoic acid acyltransferase DltB (MBOAT superfamily) [Neisseria sp. HSC-16F19]|nr:MBOAT family O-acyltransferase [Neisseria sp. HSC-16F19]MCP2041283.1 D-alanyl-lipoteichoic acid acyltransferase DltB (MBOAT superfamily) [Neisseria sp. HSC-16F19]